MPTGQLVSSFVVRFNEVGFDPAMNQKQWRIKVTHVQGEEEATVRTMEEAMDFMKHVLESGKHAIE